MFINLDKTKQKLDEIEEVVETHKVLLKRIYVYYCSFGDPLNNEWMKSVKFIKLLKDAGILSNKDE